MADITDPTALAFVNEKVRPLANHLAQTYYVGRAIVDEYQARGGVAFIPNDSSIIQDGADQDGRPVLTGQKVTRLLQLMSNIITAWETNGKRELAYIMDVANRPIPAGRGEFSA